MTPHEAPHVQVEQYHASLRVADLRAAVEFHVRERGMPAPDACSLYFVVDDPDRAHRECE